MNYTLHQLKIFTKVCAYRSITKAAEAMYLTQPAVSIQLKRFQEQFEIPLTEVLGRQLHVTSFGEKILALAHDILAKTDEIEAATDQHRGILTGNIRIATASTGKYVLPYFLTSFMRQHPGVSISVDVTNKSLVVESLRENSIDFAVVSVVPENLSLNMVSLLPNELHLAASPDYPNLPEKMKPGHLEEVTLLFREEGSATRQAMQTYLNKHGISLGRSMQLTSNEAVKQAVIAGLGLSVLPKIGIRAELRAGNICLVPIKGLPIKTEWQLVYAKGKGLSPATAAFIKHIEEHKEEVIARSFSA